MLLLFFSMVMNIARGFLGITVLIGICYLFSGNKKNVNWKLVLMALFLQLILGILLIKVPAINWVFEQIVNFFLLIIKSSEEASIFLFGDLAKPGSSFGFAFSALPIIVFFSALTSMLYYLGILQKVVYGFAWMLNRTMNLTGKESLAMAANVFIGQTEAPLVVKPYLNSMSRSEIMSLMTGGMATIAGSVFGVYVTILGGGDPETIRNFGLHLLVASIISAPAAILTAKILVPEKKDADLDKDLILSGEATSDNFLDSLARGTTDGVKLAVNVGAMLLAFMALIYLSNHVLFEIGKIGGFNDWIKESSNGTFNAFSMQYVLGLLFSPIAWIIGISSEEMMVVGRLLGEKTILNEFVAYASLADLSQQGLLSERSTLIAAYALCGFANFASIGIQIGGISAIAEKQRKTLTELGFKALIGGTIATLMTGCIAGMLI
ncbi:MAG: nucleoside transporter C-terminal domain-containing protein [Saprospiraceae bacterium]